MERIDHCWLDSGHWLLAETITIDDSEDEAPTRRRASRAQAPPGPATRASKRKREATASSTAQVDIDLSADVVQRPARKRRGVGSSSAATSARTDPEDVIVIED